MKNQLNLIGQRFGSMTVVGHAGSNGKNSLWSVKCDCGAESVKVGKEIKGHLFCSHGCPLNRANISKCRGAPAAVRVERQNNSGLKKCRTCGEDKNLAEYHKDSRSPDRLTNKCKDCASEGYLQLKADCPEVLLERGRKYRKEHPEEARASRRKYYKKYPERIKDGWLRREYGISLEDFNRMLSQQGNACAICKGGFQKTPHVDHDHATGQVRGLLCNNCNFSLGGFQDSPEICIAAAAYLQKRRLDKANHLK